MSEGSSIEEIFQGYDVFKRFNQAPEIKQSEDHTVLFELPLPEDINSLPIPRIYKSDNERDFQNFVKLPFDEASIYYELDHNGEKIQKLRWDLIKDSLKKEIKNSYQLETAIKSYNTKFANDWKFTALHKFFDEELLEEQQEQFFDELMPKIIDLALQLPDLISEIPFLRQKRNQCISMTKQQAASILANAFLCTFPNRNHARKSTDYPEINFSRLFSSSSPHVVQKIKCICNYFRRVLIQMPTGVLTFQRRFIKDYPQWSKSDYKLSSIKWRFDSQGTIESGGHGMLQVDFANRYLGGGVLGYGCVQEEIRFVVCPELIVGMLFFESMKSDETILITGAEIFNKYSGYSNTFKWEGNFVDSTPYDKFRRKQIYIVAMDAISFHKPKMQFEEFLMRRETNKAYCGFYHDPNDVERPIPIATGNWGCGAFRGAKNLKCLLQFIACVANGRNLVYFTFNDEILMKNMTEMFTFLQQKDATISQLWKCLTTFKNNMECFEDLYEYIYNNFDRLNFETCPETIDECQKLNEIESKKSDEEENENPSKRSKFSDDSSETSSSIADLCMKLNEKINEPENSENSEIEQSSSKQLTILDYFKSNP